MIDTGNDHDRRVWGEVRGKRMQLEDTKRDLYTNVTTELRDR